MGGRDRRAIVYAIDDETAIVVHETVDIISEGTWRRLA